MYRRELRGEREVERDGDREEGKEGDRCRNTKWNRGGLKRRIERMMGVDEVI
jgi:hypothetical protein